MSVSMEEGGEVWQRLIYWGIRRTGLEPTYACERASTLVKRRVWIQVGDPVCTRIAHPVGRQIEAQLFDKVRP